MKWFKKKEKKKSYFEQSKEQAQSKPIAQWTFKKKWRLYLGYNDTVLSMSMYFNTFKDGEGDISEQEIETIMRESGYNAARIEYQYILE